MEQRVGKSLRYSLDPFGQGTKSGKQDFAYGQFEWIRYPGKATLDGMMVAKCVIDPGKEWPDHIHGGYEQMLHVISGTGVHWVNEERSDLTPGTTQFLPVGVRHRMLNTGTEPLVHLSAYHPTMPQEIREITDLMQIIADEGRMMPKYALESLPISTMQAVQDKFAQAVHLGVVTVGKDGESVTSPTRLPELCQYVRSTPEGRKRCAAFDPKLGGDISTTSGPIMFECCPGIVCVAVPLKAEERVMGRMACGFVKLEEPTPDHYEALREKADSLGLCPSTMERHYRDVEVVLKAQMVAAAESLESIANAILSLSMREARRLEESQHQSEMLKELQMVSRLERELQESEFMALEARINPHFLFNALNTIAEAVAEGDERSEEIIHALSDFLRASLRNTKSTTTLSQEIRCVENYMQIQKARFGDELATSVEIGAMDVDPVVPSMILQPLVENAISHGLSKIGYRGLVRVTAKVLDGRLHIEVGDNGVGFTDVVVGLGGLEGPGGGPPAMGLRYVRSKLEHTFGTDCRFSIDSAPGEGTVVSMEMPVRDGGIDA